MIYLYNYLPIILPSPKGMNSRRAKKSLLCSVLYPQHLAQHRCLIYYCCDYEAALCAVVQRDTNPASFVIRISGR